MNILPHTPPTPAQSTRYEAGLSERARQQIEENPACLKDKVAGHYQRTGLLAAQLAGFSELLKYDPESHTLKAFVKILEDEITQDYFETFGRMPNWKEIDARP